MNNTITKAQIKEKLDNLKYEIETEYGEILYRNGSNSVSCDVFRGQLELLDGIYTLFEIDK